MWPGKNIKTLFKCTETELEMSKAHLELSLVRDAKGKKKASMCTSVAKRKPRENVFLLLNDAEYTW